jgi:cysteine synthase A
MPYQIGDAEALNVLYDLNIKEGLQLGLSTGINVAGAIRMAKEMGPGHTIVTVLCDTAQKYFSKLMDVDMLKENNLPIAPWIKGA